RAGQVNDVVAIAGIDVDGTADGGSAAQRDRVHAYAADPGEGAADCAGEGGGVVAAAQVQGGRLADGGVDGGCIGTGAGGPDERAADGRGGIQAEAAQAVGRVHLQVAAHRRAGQRDVVGAIAAGVDQVAADRNGGQRERVGQVLGAGVVVERA